MGVRGGRLWLGRGCRRPTTNQESATAPDVGRDGLASIVVPLHERTEFGPSASPLTTGMKKTAEPTIHGKSLPGFLCSPPDEAARLATAGALPTTAAGRIDLAALAANLKDMVETRCG